jgi:hypothetical protein
MVPTFEFEPRAGFGPAKLGHRREEVRAAMAAAGFPLENSNGTLDYYCDASIQTECGEGGTVDFIGVSYSPKFVARYRNSEVFALDAQEVFRLMAEADGSGPHTFERSEYRFPNQLLTLWDADPQYDRMGNESKPVWGQVGLGNEAYAAAIAKILADV